MSQTVQSTMQMPTRHDPAKSFYQFVTAAGKPAARVLVYPYGDSPVGYGLVVLDPVLTDEYGRIPQGIFYCQGFFVVPKDGPIVVFAFPEDRREDTPPPPFVLPGEATSLTVRLVDGKGKPLDGVRVTLRPTTATAPLEASFVDWALGALPAPLVQRLVRVTDATGSVTFPNLPQQGRFGLAITLPHDWPRLMTGALTLGATPRTELPPLSILRDGVIEGRVYSKRTGQPLEDVKVHIVESRPGITPYLASAITDEVGHYRFSGLLPAPYSVGVDTPDWEWLKERSAPCPPLTLRERQRRYDLPMVRSGKLIATVVGSDGRPINRMIVRIEDKEQNASVAWTNIEGKAFVTAMPGTYNVYWTTPVDSRKRDMREVKLSDGETETIRFGPPPRTTYARLPDVVLEEANGRRTTLAAFRGKVVLLALTTAAYTDVPKRMEAFMQRWGNRNVVVLVLDVDRETRIKPPLISPLRYFREVEKPTKTQDFSVTSIREFFSATVKNCCVLDVRGDIVALVESLDNDAMEKALSTATAR